MEAQNLNEVKTAYAKQTEEVTPIISAVQSLAIGKELSNEDVEIIREFESVQKYLSLPLNDPAENNIKKVFAASVVIAHQKGILKLPEGYNSAESIASIVDEGLTRIKVGYQLAEGKINPIDAEVAISDRQVIHTAAVVDVVVNKLVQKANTYVDVAEKTALSVSDKLVAMGMCRLSDIVCKSVVGVYPPAIVVVPYVKFFTRTMIPSVQKAVKKGIRMVADFARNTIIQAAPKMKIFAKKAVAKLLE